MKEELRKRIAARVNLINMLIDLRIMCFDWIANSTGEKILSIERLSKAAITYDKLHK